MEIIAYVFGIFGLMAYLETSSLKKRVSVLERELTRTKGTSYHEDRSSLVEAARSCIGKKVRIDLGEDQEDMDIVMYGNTKHGSNTILDVDEEWLSVRIDTPKGSVEKLLRMESVVRISVAPEE